MIFMVVEKFLDTAEVYRRLRLKGRMMPEGLEFVSSWVNLEKAVCFQVVETHDAELGKWADRWKDIVEFEFTEVTPSDIEDGPPVSKN